MRKLSLFLMAVLLFLTSTLTGSITSYGAGNAYAADAKRSAVQRPASQRTTSSKPVRSSFNRAAKPSQKTAQATTTRVGSASRNLRNAGRQQVNVKPKAARTLTRNASTVARSSTKPKVTLAPRLPLGVRPAPNQSINVQSRATKKLSAAKLGIPTFLSPRQKLHIAPVSKGRSILTANPNRLLNGLHNGSFRIIRQPKPGQVIVDFGKTIGEYWSSGVKVGKTRYGSVMYGKKGAHIIPANPYQW